LCVAKDSLDLQELPSILALLISATFERRDIVWHEPKPFAADSARIEAPVPILLDAFGVIGLDDVNMLELLR
jgi:hypothetical protein